MYRRKRRNNILESTYFESILNVSILCGAIVPRFYCHLENGPQFRVKLLVFYAYLSGHILQIVGRPLKWTSKLESIETSGFCVTLQTT